MTPMQSDFEPLTPSTAPAALSHHFLAGLGPGVFVYRGEKITVLARKPTEPELAAAVLALASRDKEDQAAELACVRGAFFGLAKACVLWPAASFAGEPRTKPDWDLIVHLGLKLLQLAGFPKPPTKGPIQ